MLRTHRTALISSFPSPSLGRAEEGRVIPGQFSWADLIPETTCAYHIRNVTHASHRKIRILHGFSHLKLILKRRVLISVSGMDALR